MALSRMKSMKLRFVMWVARLLGVPVDVHQSYFGAKVMSKKSG